MASHQESESFDVDQDDLILSCRASLNEMANWKISKEGENFFEAKKSMTFNENPQDLKITIAQQQESCVLNVKGSMFGLGPIMTGKARESVRTFLSGVKLKLADLTKQNTSTGGIAEELEKLADMKEKGFLSDEEFAAAKAKLLK
tara:strand:+ start:203 stop:637 length:435 start_codon:yes stop_codon:yes gene_type:complete